MPWPGAGIALSHLRKRPVKGQTYRDRANRGILHPDYVERMRLRAALRLDAEATEKRERRYGDIFLPPGVEL